MDEMKMEETLERNSCDGNTETMLSFLNLSDLVDVDLKADIDHVDYDQPELRIFNASDNDLNYVDCDYIDVNSEDVTLNVNDHDLIDCLSVSFYEARKRNPIDLNLHKRMACLLQVTSESMLKKMSQLALTNFIVQPIKRVITFAKLLADFRRLELADQKCLLVGSCLEILILSSSSLYDFQSNKLVNVLRKDEQRTSSGEQSSIQLDMLRYIWSEDLYDKTIGFLRSVCELEADQATLVLLISIILFSPDRAELKNRAHVVLVQSKYMFLLKKYMIWKYGRTEDTIKQYNRLLLKLIDVRTLSEMHATMLVQNDVATNVMEINSNLKHLNTI